MRTYTPQKMTVMKFSLACALLVLLGLSVSAEGLQMTSGINSYGIIKYSERAQSVFIKRYAITSSFSDMDAETVAELFDMCQAGRSAAEKIRQVHQIRQDFKGLLYRNFLQIYTYADEWQMAVDNGWLLKDENGQYVRSTGYSSNYYVDFGNPDYQAFVANWLKGYLDQGFDGVFADGGLIHGAGEAFYHASATPINPRTGTYWTHEEAREAMNAFHNKVKQVIGSKLLICNGIYEGSRFWQSYDVYVEVLSNSPLDGFMSEGTWYGVDGYWYSEEAWKKCLDFVVWTQNNFPNKIFVPVCKIKRTDGSYYPLPPDCTPEQMITYAFASTFLAVKTNQNYLCFGLPTSMADVDFSTQVVQPLYDVDVGTPVNDYYVIEGTHVYARDFSNVKVLVNPTSSSYTVSLDGTFETLDGEPILQITMKGHTGIILLGA